VGDGGKIAVVSYDQVGKVVSLSEEYTNSSLGALRGVVNLETDKFYVSSFDESKLFLVELSS
jgi:hypothetical protein